MSGGRPAWLDRVLAEVEREQPAAFEIFAPPVDPERRSAVLMLFGPTGDGGTDVVLTTIGRTPAVELFVPADHRPPAAALVDVAQAVRQHTRETRPCT